jgi:DegV family protein with EDD domain
MSVYPFVRELMMGNGISIVTDSTAVLTADDLKKYDIHVVPLKVIFGEEAYNEGKDISNEEFYRRLSQGETPTTSHPSEEDFIKVYRKLVGEGKAILSIHTPSKLSGTVTAAQAARAKFPEAEIEIIDSLTIGLGMLILPAVQAAAKGKSLAQIKESIERLNAAIYTIGALNTLDYLRRGGRIGRARALLGSMLRIKPLLSFREGEVEILGKARTTSRAIREIADFVGRNVEGDAPIYAAVVYTSDSKPALSLNDELQSRFNCAELDLLQLGPVLGTHIGPGFFGIGFYSEEDWKSE